jgi:hypothetical protein
MAPEDLNRKGLPAMGNESHEFLPDDPGLAQRAGRPDGSA